MSCIFVEEFEDSGRLIIQLDENIKLDEYKYTAWRKFIGESDNIRVDILLIHNDKLYTLKNELVEFESLGRNDVKIDKEYLARFDMK